MRVKILLLTFYGLSLTMLGVKAQSYNYVQYTTKDGLAGTTVYDMCQDEDGFLWFATNNGLSRFDGQKFTNYTVKDGLPDNEVLRLFSDSYGRVWIGTFRNEICYYFHGKFFNKGNDKMLAEMSFEGRVTEFAELPNGTVWIMGMKELYKINQFDKLNLIFPKKSEYNNFHFGLGGGPKWFGDYFPLLIEDSLFYIKDDSIIYYSKFSFKGRLNEIYYPIKKPKDTSYVKFDVDIIKSTGRDYIPYFTGTVNGAYEIDTLTFTITNKFLPGKTITCALIDKERIYWFSSLGDGVYKLASKDALTSIAKEAANAGNEVFAILPDGKNIMAGHNSSQMIVWDQLKKPQIHSFKSYLPQSQNKLSTNRLNSIVTDNEGNFILGFDAFLVKWNKTVKKIAPLIAVKSLFLESDKVVVAATGVGVFRLAISNLQIIDTIWKQRATYAIQKDDSYYVGTINGLIEIKKGKNDKQLGSLHPSLNRRISFLQVHKNSLWVATSDSGIVEIKDGKISTTYSEKDGLPSNIVRTLFAKDNFLWVGTNKGICKIDISKKGSIPIKYNSSNLLPNDLIDAIYADSDKVYVGSPSGLTFFEEGQLSAQSICNLNLEWVKTEKGTVEKDTIIKLPYKLNRFEVSYTGISMKSGGEMLYYYRMRGLESTWQLTFNNEITYVALPPGDYTFEMYAQNKFGVKSKVLSIKVNVNTPFWQHTWFILGMIAFIFGLFYVGIKYRNASMHKKLEEKNKVQLQMASLEQKALQAQMNPHFVFNCLNSIQQYILSNEPQSANYFLSIFAGLIRETLDNSAVSKISLQQELNYLQKYLDLERLRFGNSFQYQFVTRDSFSEKLIMVPVMLLQPYVENAIRHGIRYRKDGEGLIELIFIYENNNLICLIRDNGIGRAASGAIKAKMKIEYQSKGMDLTAKRIEIYNKVYENKISVEIKDLFDSSGLASGTEVKIIIGQTNDAT